MSSAKCWVFCLSLNVITDMNFQDNATWSTKDIHLTHFLPKCFSKNRFHRTNTNSWYIIQNQNNSTYCGLNHNIFTHCGLKVHMSLKFSYYRICIFPFLIITNFISPEWWPAIQDLKGWLKRLVHLFAMMSLIMVKNWRYWTILAKKTCTHWSEL